LTKKIKKVNIMVVQSLLKYILEGLAVAFVAYFIPAKAVTLEAVVLIGVTAAATFAVLDTFSPEIGLSARQGAGFGIGLNQAGWSGGGCVDSCANGDLPLVKEGDLAEPFEDCLHLCDNDSKTCQDPNHPCNATEEETGDNNQFGTTVDGHPVKHQKKCLSYYYDAQKSPSCKTCQPPLDDLPLAQPFGMRSLPPNFSETNVKSRCMKFSESSCPVNRNTNEYKLVPGLYSKYIVQPGYNEDVGTYNQNEVDRLFSVKKQESSTFGLDQTMEQPEED
jgi:hypothetical protein